jgi:hypothetical protein
LFKGAVSTLPRSKRALYSPPVAVGFALLALGAGMGAPLAASSTVEEVQRIGLRPLFEALVAVANCPDLTINRREFGAVAARYHLTPTDLTPYGRFGPDIAFLYDFYKVRIDDDRGAFCSAERLNLAVLRGVLRPTGLPALR